MVDDRNLVAALRRQWARIASVAGQLDLEAPSRVRGWRNAGVLAHLAVQPVLLARFLDDATTRAPTMRLEDNLARTRALGEKADAAARSGANAGQVDFAHQAASVDTAPGGADVGLSVTTLQGPIRLRDYLRTRGVEGVMHGIDLPPPVVPDPTALGVAVDALMDLFRTPDPQLAATCELQAERFIDVATGRAAAPAELADVMPLMA